MHSCIPCPQSHPLGILLKLAVPSVDWPTAVLTGEKCCSSCANLSALSWCRECGFSYPQVTMPFDEWVKLRAPERASLWAHPGLDESRARNGHMLDHAAEALARRTVPPRIHGGSQ